MALVALVATQVFRVILVLVGFLVIAEYLAIAESQDTAGFQAILVTLVFQVITGIS